LAKIKGIYPYNYTTGISKFRETRLPPKEMFYNALNESEITDEEYQRAQDAWTAFDCKTLQNFHDTYLMTDALLLGDVFEHFRSLCMNNYGLDPALFFTPNRVSLFKRV